MTVFALHGFCGSPSDFSFLGDQVIPLDLLSFPDVSIAALAKSLADALPKGSFLIGYSMGGRIALEILKQQGEKLSGALLISTHPGLTTSKEQKERLLSDCRLASRLKHPGFLPYWNKQPLFKEGKRGAMRDPSLFRKKVILWSLGRQKKEQTLLESNKLTFLVGEKDTKYRNLVQEIKGAHVVVAKACGHRVLLEGKSIIKEVLDDCLRRCGVDHDQKLQGNSLFKTSWHCQGSHQ